jgi:putative membrane protein
MGYLTPESKQALTAAVQSIELASSAEVVVVMRPASTSALLACSLAACAGGLLGLAFLLFSPWPFTNEAIWFDTLLAGGSAAVVCWRFNGIRRWITPRSRTRREVLLAAKAEFLERGICETRERSGVLVYVSQSERCACVIADRGVRTHVDPAAWASAVAQIEASVHEHTDGVLLAGRVRALGPMLASALPRRDDDTNELDDGVVSA